MGKLTHAVVSFTVLLTTVQCFLEVSQGQLSQSDIHALQTRLEEEKAQRILLQNDLEVLMGKFAAFERDNTILQTIQKTVSFTTKLNSDTHLNIGQRLILDNVMSNHGNGYDNRHGFFQSPINGTFLFSLTCACVAAKVANLVIMKNDQGLVYAESTSSLYAETASISVVTDLTTADEVWIKNGFLSGPSYARGSGYTAFTGVYLHS